MNTKIKRKFLLVIALLSVFIPTMLFGWTQPTQAMDQAGQEKQMNKSSNDDFLIFVCEQFELTAFLGQAHSMVCTLTNTTPDTVGHNVNLWIEEPTGKLNTSITPGNIPATDYNDPYTVTVEINIPVDASTGTYTVIAHAQGEDTNHATQEFEIQVDAPVLERIDITPAQITMNLEEQQQFQAKGYDSKGSEIAINPIWSASGEAITSGGLFTADKPGDVTVTASVEGSSVTGTATVHVDAPVLERIDITPAQITMNLEGQQQFQAKGYDSKGSDIAINPIWSASGEAITSGGLFTADKPGDVTVTASVEGSSVTGTATVHVDAPVLERIDVTPAQVTMNLEGQQQFQAKGYDSKGKEIAINPIWSASGETITSGGLFTADKPGDVTITASVEGSSVTGTATVHVEPKIPYLILGVFGIGLIALIVMVFWYFFIGRSTVIPFWFWLLFGIVCLILLWIIFGSFLA